MYTVQLTAIQQVTLNPTAWYASSFPHYKYMQVKSFQRKDRARWQESNIWLRALYVSLTFTAFKEHKCTSPSGHTSWRSQGDLTVKNKHKFSNGFLIVKYRCVLCVIAHGKACELELSPKQRDWIMLNDVSSSAFDVPQNRYKYTTNLHLHKFGITVFFFIHISAFNLKSGEP